MAELTFPAEFCHGIHEIAAHHTDLEASFKLYFSANSPEYFIRFAGYTVGEVTDELSRRLDEADLTSSLTLLASIEAAFRLDYLQRCRLRKKDSISRRLRSIYKNKRNKACLDEDIFEAWKNNSPEQGLLIRELRSAFRFRHWLAHGRYWEPRLGRQYDFYFVYTLAELIADGFPLLRD